MTVLKTKKLNKSFGGLQAVSNVDIEVSQGELLGLIGPNGAGKTTIFNLLTGVYIPTSGTIDIRDRKGNRIRINGLKPHVTARHGVSRTFQNIRLFKELSVIDNLRIAMHKNVKYNVFEAMLRLGKFYKSEETFTQTAEYILELVGLLEKKNELAKNLPYGEQRRLEIARAVATNASIIFLDEPAAGMNPSETAELSKLIKKLKDEFELTIILIEHDMRFVMNLCERIYVLDFGTIIASGKPEEIRKNKQVIEAYLGEEQE